jgi:hypothetical protein
MKFIASSLVLALFLASGEQLTGIKNQVAAVTDAAKIINQSLHKLKVIRSHQVTSQAVIASLKTRKKIYYLKPIFLLTTNYKARQHTR